VTNEKTTARIVAIAIGFCAAACTYSLSRILQAALFPDPDPRLVTHVARIAFFWRAGISAYVGAMIVMAALALRDRRGTWLDEQLPKIVLATLAFTLGQGLLVP